MAQQKYIILLRGINVGGNKKVPMADLKKLLEQNGAKHVLTLLNSGNVIAALDNEPEAVIEARLSALIEAHFGFAVPILVRTAKTIYQLVKEDPFRTVPVTKDTRLYITFLKEPSTHTLTLPWQTADAAFTILQVKDRIIYSVLDLGQIQTTKGMEMLDKLFGKNNTTRNWNTIQLIHQKLHS